MAVAGMSRASNPIDLVPSPPNDQVEQLAANTPTIPQDAIASLLQRLVRHCPIVTRRLRSWRVRALHENPSHRLLERLVARKDGAPQLGHARDHVKRGIAGQPLAV
jgi:hypothetical protein